MRGVIRLLAVLALICAGAFAVNARTMTPDEFRKTGFVALTAGRPREALAIADALLSRDPKDVSALILRSRALRDTGQYVRARRAARKAWNTSTGNEQRYGAALAMAQAWSSAGHRTIAQIWLRRAVQVAPTPLARQIAVRDYSYVRSRNPWIVDLDFSAAPSSNLNGGSTADVLAQVYDPFSGTVSPVPIPPDAKALSGFRAISNLRLRYRLPPGAMSQNELRFNVETRTNWLSPESRKRAPDVKGSDFNLNTVELGWGGQARTTGSDRLYSYGVAVGRTWYGGPPLNNYLHLELGAQQPLGPRNAVAGRIYGEGQKRLDEDRRSARILGMDASLVHRLQTGDEVQLTVGLEDTASDSYAVKHRDYRVTIAWQKARKVAGVRLSGALGYRYSDYPDWAFLDIPAPRHDNTYWAQLALTFDRAAVYGFSPVLSLTGTRTRSTEPLYQSEDFGLSVGFRSQF